jgi:hypothetical protein
MDSDAHAILHMMDLQAEEHAAWLDVVTELRTAGAGAIERGQPNERLHDAITRWAEELVQLRMGDPNAENAGDALNERRAHYARWTGGT